MGWLLIGLILYLLTFIAEQALVEITPHEMQLWEQKSGSFHAFLLNQALKPRKMLFSMLLARVLIQVITVVFAVWIWLDSDYLQNIIKQSESVMSQTVVESLTVILLILVLASLFWGIHFLRIVRATGRQPSWVLIWLSPFLYVWRALFSFLYKKPSPGVTEPAKNGDDEKPPSEAIEEQTRDLELLKSIIKFSDVTVKQVMQQRSKVVAMDIKSGYHEVLEMVRESGFSRIPVYDEDLDNVQGILYVKDLINFREQPDDFNWQPLLRKDLMHVPEAKQISELLKDFKVNKMHMAIVVDEYGGSSGVVTMEDVLEEVTGEIQDEFDEENELNYRKIDESTYLFEGQTLLNDVCRITGIAADQFDEIRGNADTLAGLILETQGDIPKTGFTFSWSGYGFTITHANKRQIRQIMLNLPH